MVSGPSFLWSFLRPIFSSLLLQLIFTQFWLLPRWSNDPTGSTFSYLSVYAAVAIGAVGLVFIRAFIWAQIVVNASGTLHQRLLVNILRQPCSFFDTTPIGRILTRFAADIDQIDSAISQTMQVRSPCAQWMRLQL